MTKADLIRDIDTFIDSHAKIAAAYDPEFDDLGDRFNGPDSSMLWAAARALEADRAPDYVHSDFGSGCYAPITDAAVKDEHDRLVAAVNEIAKRHG